VITTRKTTVAAQRLGVSQPAVSRAIASLEGRLQRALFLRDGGRLVPTAEALALDAEAEPIFATLARLQHWPRPLEKGSLLTIATTTSLAGSGLARLLAAFRGVDGATRVRIGMGGSDQAVAAVAEGSADIGLVEAPVDHAGVRVEILHRSLARCLMRSDHRLARRDRVMPGDLAGEPCLALTRRFAARARVEAAFADAGVEPRFVMEAESPEFVGHLVRAGAGLAVVDPFPIAAGLDAGLVLVPFEPEIAFGAVFLMSAAGSSAAVARRFIDLARAELAGGAFAP
jgi:DNA-binding transcriptional LysR family regulator